MTQETFNKAKGLNNLIEEYKAFLRAYNSPYSNEIKAYSFDAHVENTKILILGNDSELEMMIREHIIHKIEVLEQEFAKLK